MQSYIYVRTPSTIYSKITRTSPAPKKHNLFPMQAQYVLYITNIYTWYGTYKYPVREGEKFLAEHSQLLKNSPQWS
jgi:hypothetical protein